MGSTTVRQIMPDRPTASTYWRRRFIALVVSLSVLALITWALSGAFGGSSPAANTAATRQVHGHLPPSQPPKAGGAQHSPGTDSDSHPARQQSTPALAAPRPCPSGDVVLSLFSSQASYTIRQTPEFEVDVVSTAPQTCTFDIGARHVWLEVKAGPLVIWSSAECAEGEASLIAELQRGVPTVVPIGWDGQRSGPGCPGPGTAAASGSYSAVATDGAGVSNEVPFRIG
jgi:hypothetical protein